MNESGLNKYLDGMENGEWGDGIVLSAAVRLYNRPIVIVTPDGRADDWHSRWSWVMCWAYEAWHGSIVITTLASTIPVVLPKAMPTSLKRRVKFKANLQIWSHYLAKVWYGGVCVWQCVLAVNFSICRWQQLYVGLHCSPCYVQFLTKQLIFASVPLPFFEFSGQPFFGRSNENAGDWKSTHPIVQCSMWWNVIIIIIADINVGSGLGLPPVFTSQYRVPTGLP